MATQTQNPMTGVFEQFGEQFNKTLKSSVDFQEQTSRFWKDFFSQGSKDVQGQFDKVSSDVLPFGRANIERMQRMFDEQADRTVELFHETFEVGKAQGPSEVYEELLKMWRRSFDFVRESNEMFAKTNADMFEQFSNFSRGGFQVTNGKPAHKAPPK